SWEEGNLRQARKLLDAARPKVGEADMRGFEWRYLWQLCQGDARVTLRGHGSEVVPVVFSPDGRLLASGGVDGKVRLWSTALRQEVAHLDQRSPVFGLAFSPDGRLLASGSSDGKLRLWEVRSWRPIATLPQFADWRHCLAFSPDGKILAWSGVRK